MTLKCVLIACCILCGVSAVVAQAPSVKLFDFQTSTCQDDEESERLRTRIISKVRNGDVMTIEIAGRATCCVDFLPELTLTGNVIDLNFRETGAPCECHCCYTFTYHIAGVSNDNYQITFRGKPIEQTTEQFLTYVPTYDLLNGDTVNYKDKYGLRQGRWMPNSKNHNRYVEYEDDKLSRIVTLHDGGTIKSEKIYEKIELKSFHEGRIVWERREANRLVEYYETGVKKRECYNDAKSNSNNFEQGVCKEWNEKGELIREGKFQP